MNCPEVQLPDRPLIAIRVPEAIAREIVPSIPPGGTIDFTTSEAAAPVAKYKDSPQPLNTVMALIAAAVEAIS